jgi:hypothetical protein
MSTRRRQGENARRPAGNTWMRRRRDQACAASGPTTQAITAAQANWNRGSCGRVARQATVTSPNTIQPTRFCTGLKAISKPRPPSITAGLRRLGSRISQPTSSAASVSSSSTATTLVTAPPFVPDPHAAWSFVVVRSSSRDTRRRARPSDAEPSPARRGAVTRGTQDRGCRPYSPDPPGGPRRPVSTPRARRLRGPDDERSCADRLRQAEQRPIRHEHPERDGSPRWTFPVHRVRDRRRRRAAPGSSPRRHRDDLVATPGPLSCSGSAAGRWAADGGRARA